MKFKLVWLSVLILSLFVFCGNKLTFASSEETIDKKTDLYEEFSRTIDKDNEIERESFLYIQDAIGQQSMTNIISEYKEVYSNSQADLMIKNNLKNVYEEVNANNFSKKQASDLFVSASNLEIGNAVESEMTFSSEIPNFAPSHDENLNIEDLNSFEFKNDDINYRSSDDRSSRTSYEKGGVGYEVKSNLGYNKTTTFLDVGNCNVLAPEGKAGYMFYTIYYNNKYQDIGIGYFGGKWKAIVSGNWTGWGVGTVPISYGDRLYFKIWIGGDNKIYFQILDGNNFSRIIFQNSYTTHGEIPSSGSGVGFNRQITLVDTAHRPKSGLYLKNAAFDQSYIYNNNTTVEFNDYNTNRTRRGKFGCSWASDSTVSILNNSHWSSEKISIEMR